MRFAVVLTLAALVAGVMAPAALAEEQQPKAYVVGDTIADFSFPDINGKTVKLSDYKDKVVVIQFFAHW